MEVLMSVISWFNHLIAALCQVLAMIVIFMGVTKAFIVYVRDVRTKYKASEAIAESRLEIGHSFSLALALLIGASILHTTLAPNWTDIGQLASIIAIRTGLNYFLMRELGVGIKEEECKEAKSS